MQGDKADNKKIQLKKAADIHFRRMAYPMVGISILFLRQHLGGMRELKAIVRNADESWIQGIYIIIMWRK